MPYTSQPAFGSLAANTQFVVAIACGLTVGHRHYGLGERIPHKEIPAFSLHSLYNLRRIAVGPIPEPEAVVGGLPADLPGAVINSRPSPGPVRPPRR